MARKDPKKLTIDLKKLMKLSVSQRLSITRTPAGQSWLASLSPTEYAKLFPSYYKKKLADMGIKPATATPAGAASPDYSAPSGGYTSPSVTTPSATPASKSTKSSGATTSKEAPKPSPGLIYPWQKKLNEMAAASAPKQNMAWSPSSGTLLSIRSKQMKELEDPRVKRAVLARAEIEIGGQSQKAQQAWLESMFNRAAANRLSLYDAVSQPPHHRYYPAKDQSRWERLANNPNSINLEKKFAGHLATVGSGSNIINYATDNSSSGLAKRKALKYPDGVWIDGEFFNADAGTRAKWAQKTKLADKEALTDPSKTTQENANGQKSNSAMPTGIRPNVDRMPDKDAPKAKFQPGIEKRAEKLSQGTRDALERFRLSSPNFEISSTYRGPDHPIERRKSRPGNHSKGIAIDVSTRNKSEEELRGVVQNLKKSGFNYILLEGNPPHIHAEVRPNQTDTIIRNLGQGHPGISLESAKEAADKVEYNSILKEELKRNEESAKQQSETSQDTKSFTEQLEKFPEFFRKQIEALPEDQKQQALQNLQNLPPEKLEEFRTSIAELPKEKQEIVVETIREKAPPGELPKEIEKELPNFNVEYRTRAEMRKDGERYGRTPDKRTTFLDFNASKEKGSKGWLILVPDDATEDEIKRVKENRDGFIKLADKYGYKNYKTVPGGKHGPGIVTTSENIRRGGKGVSGTYHTEPGFAGDKGFRELMGNPDFIRDYARLNANTLGRIPGMTFQRPHGDRSAPTGAAMTLPSGEYVTEHSLAPRILKQMEIYKEELVEEAKKKASTVTPEKTTEPPKTLPDPAVSTQSQPEGQTSQGAKPAGTRYRNLQKMADKPGTSSVEPPAGKDGTTKVEAKKTSETVVNPSKEPVIENYYAGGELGVEASKEVMGDVLHVPEKGPQQGTAPDPSDDVNKLTENAKFSAKNEIVTQKDGKVTVTPEIRKSDLLNPVQDKERQYEIDQESEQRITENVREQLGNDMASIIKNQNLDRPAQKNENLAAFHNTDGTGEMEIPSSYIRALGQTASIFEGTKRSPTVPRGSMYST